MKNIYEFFFPVFQKYYLHKLLFCFSKLIKYNISAYLIDNVDGKWRNSLLSLATYSCEKIDIEESICVTKLIITF